MSSALTLSRLHTVQGAELARAFMPQAEKVAVLEPQRFRPSADWPSPWRRWAPDRQTDDSRAVPQVIGREPIWIRG